MQRGGCFHPKQCTGVLLFCEDTGLNRCTCGSQKTNIQKTSPLKHPLIECFQSFTLVKGLCYRYSDYHIQYSCSWHCCAILISGDYFKNSIHFSPLMLFNPGGFIHILNCFPLSSLAFCGRWVCVSGWDHDSHGGSWIVLAADCGIHYFFIITIVITVPFISVRHFLL